MKAMLEARMVAARIQGLAPSAHGSATGADGLIVSQGVLIVTMMCFERFRLLKSGV
jgi:hypothetical protein